MFSFLFIVFFLYLDIINQASISLQTCDCMKLFLFFLIFFLYLKLSIKHQSHCKPVTLKYYSHLNLAYTKDLAVQLLKSVQNECRNLYDRWSEDCCWEDFFLSANIYDETTEHKGSYRSSLHLCDELRQSYINYISRYSYLNISCCNIIFFSRISQLYKQSHFKAAHCSNECESALKTVSLWFTQIWRKRVKFRPWLQQIVVKLNVNMSNNNVSVQFWYLHS
jgi:hypothetical protein